MDGGPGSSSGSKTEYLIVIHAVMYSMGNNA